MFEKTLQDMVKDIRARARNKVGLESYVSSELQNVKSELKKSDTAIKANAVAKLTYLKMLGYDTSWAAFHIIEVMSVQKFKYKRIGYLAATQVFPQNKELVLLCTNLLKKDLHSKHPYAIGTAVNCVANIMDRDLARDLLDDLTSMMTSSKAYTRKKAVLVMFKAFEMFPQSLPLVFDNLKKKLLDEDASVVSCTINVVCELANIRSRNYVPLVPVLFTILQNTQNNWMLIKVVKLLVLLMPEEPRLAKKAIPPLCNIIQTTQAKSLMYECISAVTFALKYIPNQDSFSRESVQPIVQLCSEKLKMFLLDQDQNLKYLGLVGFSSMMHFSKDYVGQHRAVILKCLQDPDMTIRLRALDLLCGMITQHNIVEVVQKLLKHAEFFEDNYRDAVVEKILSICSMNKYHYVSDFAWYVSTLVALVQNNAMSFGNIIGGQLIDICARVTSVRCFAVLAVARILSDERMFYNRPDCDRGMDTILMSSAFIIGEYIDTLQYSDNTKPVADALISEDSMVTLRYILLNSLLSTRTHDFAPTVQGCFIHSAMKIILFFASLETIDIIDVNSLVDAAVAPLARFAKSTHIELRERATSAGCILSILKNMTPHIPRKEFLRSIMLIYVEHLRVVNEHAQNSVPIPNNLSISSWIESDEEHMAKMTRYIPRNRIAFFSGDVHKNNSFPIHSLEFGSPYQPNEWEFLNGNSIEITRSKGTGTTEMNVTTAKLDQNALIDSDKVHQIPERLMSSADIGAAAIEFDSLVKKNDEFLNHHITYTVSQEEAMPSDAFNNKPKMEYKEGNAGHRTQKSRKKMKKKKEKKERKKKIGKK